MNTIPDTFFKPWKFTPVVDFESGTFGVELDMNGEITRKVASIQDDCIRKSLQALGWTSPEDTLELNKRLKEINERLELLVERLSQN